MPADYTILDGTSKNTRGTTHCATNITFRHGSKPRIMLRPRGAESRADFIHKLGIVEKELNETSVWLRIVSRANLGKQDIIVAILQENVQLARIITASIRTAKARSQAASQNDN